MGPWIQAAKDHMFEIVRKTQQETPNSEVRVAFVGYRDYGDRPHFISYSFRNVDDVLDLIQDVDAFGGDDAAEDVAGGLLCARLLLWDRNAVKSLIHIADAPAHGSQFHEPIVADRFPDGDPGYKNPLTFMNMFSEENIDYTFIKTNDSTDIMIKQFHNVYTGPGKFRVLDLRPQTGNNFGREVMRSISETTMRHISLQDPTEV